MKKIIILILLLVLPLVLSAQLSGLGTFASPYSGTFQGNLQWNTGNFSSGKVYIGGDVTIDNEQLVIGAGMKIVFVSAGADLIINGTGRMDAIGTSGSGMITFTADFNDNSAYGETGERWGHIIFNNPSSSNQSTLEYCIIEWGDVSSGSNTTSYGGGIYSNTYSNLNLTNCTIRNNKATHGGGLMAYNGSASPTFLNCFITENTATISGGGLYLPSGCTSIITNSIISNNSSGSGGGGGIFLDVSGNVRVINSIFVKNITSNTARGYNIQYYNISSTTNRPSFKNCIAWGSDNSITHLNYSQQASDFVNSAIQDVSTPASSYTNCIDLNATNSVATGPNFIDPDLPGTDWSIIFSSPCRDAGTTPSPTIPNDYIGNSRIGPYDIGAYEVQYSRWRTDASNPTSWTDPVNWELGYNPGYNGTTGDVVISPLSSSSFAPDISGTVSVSSGKYLILNPGAMATIGTISNSGTLRLESSATGISSLKVNTVTGNSANVQLYLTGGYIGNPLLRVGRWHYISSPFDPSTPLSVSPFTANTYDLARWVDGIQSPSSILLGFVAYDGFVYNDSDPADPSTFWGGTFSTLTTGKGYNFWDDLSSFNYSLTGKLNTADLPVTLDFAGAAYENGYNLLGNPFSSGLNWDDIINSVYYPFPSNTSKGLYFTRDNTECSYIAGVGVPADVTGIIPPMQGFFTKTYSTGNTITLAAAARVNDNIHARYKGQTIIPLVRLEIDKDSLSKDETVVRFDDKALPTLDNEFDALKMFLSASKTSIYSSDGSSKYSINGQPFPATEVQIPVIVNLQLAGNHKISTNQLQGLDNYNVTLIDNTTGFIADLKSTPEILFSADAGTSSGRFVLKISTLITGIEKPGVSNGIFNIYPGQNLLNIQTIADEWDGKSGSVRVLDLTGKTVSDLSNAEFTKNSLIQVQSPVAKGMYVVEIRSGVKRYVGKVIIK